MSAPITPKMMLDNYHRNRHDDVAARLGGGNRRPYDVGPVTPLDLAVGDVVRFRGEKIAGKYRRTTVRAVSERFVICTFPIKGQTAYSIISWEKSWRGPHDHFMGLATDAGYATRIYWEVMLEAMDSGEAEMSHRSSVRLDIASVHRGDEQLWPPAAGTGPESESDDATTTEKEPS